MKDEIKNGYIHWVDGMKISKDHFINMQRAVEDRIRDARCLGLDDDRFGLLPGKVNGRESLEYNLLIEHPDTVVMEIYQCRAVTPAGDRVEVVSSLNNKTVALRKEFKLDLDYSPEHVQYDIILRVGSYDMAPYGEPDPSETPPRHPFSGPSFSLDITPTKEIRYNEYNRNFVVLSRVEVFNKEVTELRTFIPPSMTLESTSALMEFYFAYLKFLNDIEQDLFRIIIKLNNVERPTLLASNVGELCRRMLGFIEREMDAVTNIYRTGAPKLLVTHTKGFARSIRNGIELLTNTGKDELLNYIKEVISVDPGEYMGIQSGIISLEYDHYDINASLEKVMSFCRLNGRLFKELSGLDYIGKKKNTDIYVAEKSINAPQESKVKRKWDF